MKVSEIVKEKIALMFISGFYSPHQFTSSLCSCEFSAGNMPLCFILVLVGTLRIACSVFLRSWLAEILCSRSCVEFQHCSFGCCRCYTVAAAVYNCDRCSCRWCWKF